MLQPGSDVLDAGCGSGKNMNLRKDCSYTGLDKSQELVKICLEKGYDAEVGDVTRLTYWDDIFDAVMCVAVIHHLETHAELRHVPRELVRVTKPLGVVMIQVWEIGRAHV